MPTARGRLIARGDILSAGDNKAVQTRPSRLLARPLTRFILFLNILLSNNDIIIKLLYITHILSINVIIIFA